MRISSRYVSELLEKASAQQPTFSARPGQILVDSSSQNHGLVLVVRGRVRVVDLRRVFGASTLILDDAPYLGGLARWIDPQAEELLLAASECEAVSLELTAEQVHALLSKQLATVEWPLLANTMQERRISANSSFINLPNELFSSLQFLMQASRLVWSDTALVNQPATSDLWFYADPVHLAYHYGEMLSSQALKQLASQDLSHRLVLVSAEPRSPAVEVFEGAPRRLSVASPVPEEAKNPSLPSGFTRATTEEDVHRSLITVLLQFYEVPFRRDLLTRASSYLQQPEGPSCFDRYAAVLEQLGLETRKLSIPQEDLRRAPTPFLTTDREDQLVLIATGPDQKLVVINPRKGLSPYDPSCFSNEALECLHVHRGRNTPENKFSIRWLLPYVSQYRVGLIEVFIASLFTQLLSLASPLLFQQIIDRVIGQGAQDSLTGLALLMVIFALLEVVFGSLRTFQFADISNRIDIEMGSSIIAHMLRLNARFFEKRPVGELASRLNELDNIRRFLTGTALTVTLDALFASLYLVVMFIYSPLLSMITVATLPLLMIATVGISPITQRLLRQRSEAYAKTQSFMVEILNGIQTIKLQSSESMTRKKWEEMHLATINRGFKTTIANTASGNALQLINKLSSVAIIVAGAALVLRSEMTLGEFIAFRIISGYVTQPILRVASAWQGFQEMTLSFERLADVINQPLESPEQERNQFVMPELEGAVVFDHVSFGYSQSAPAQLSGFSLSIPAGSFTGIVGQSGCGKSTLLKLLPRLYRPTQGRVLVDDIDISKVDLYSHRSQLGYVPQECLLFEGTILSNLTFKDSKVELDQVVAAAKLASAHDFIMSLPYGYSTPVGEKGAGLSGGQRQRIALARMLLQKPRMIILDEATSALDADTELQVVNNVRRHAKGKTILMITHRLSALKAADQIVVMHEGTLDSVGTHRELMQRMGRYYVLYQQQFGGIPE